MSNADRKIYSIKQACEIEQKAYQQGRADAIEEFYAKCREKYWFSSDFMNFFNEVRKQLKGEQNE